MKTLSVEFNIEQINEVLQLNAKIIDKNSKNVIKKQLNEEFCNNVIANEFVDVISELDQPYKI